MREYSEERMEWRSWNRGWKRMIGRNVGMEEFEGRMVENVREKCWDRRVGREYGREC